MKQQEEMQVRNKEKTTVILEEVLQLLGNGIELSDIVMELKKIGENEKNGPNKIKRELMVVISDFLTYIGMPTHIKGYKYTRQAIIYYINNSEKDIAITKEVYPNIAKDFNTSSSRVERAIRHAIEITWDRGDIYIFDEYFGNSINPAKGKPTNCEFITMVSQMYALGKI